MNNGSRELKIITGFVFRNKQDIKVYNIVERRSFFFLSWWSTVETFRNLDDAIEHMALRNMVFKKDN